MGRETAMGTAREMAIPNPTAPDSARPKTHRPTQRPLLHRRTRPARTKASAPRNGGSSICGHSSRKVPPLDQRHSPWALPSDSESVRHTKCLLDSAYEQFIRFDQIHTCRASTELAAHSVRSGLCAPRRPAGRRLGRAGRTRLLGRGHHTGHLRDGTSPQQDPGRVLPCPDRGSACRQARRTLVGRARRQKVAAAPAYRRQTWTPLAASSTAS